MARRGWKLSLVAIVCGFGALALAQNPLPQGPGAQLVYTKCQTCHDIKYVTASAGISPDMWDETISEMEEFGLEITAEERKTMLTYLTAYLNPAPTPHADPPASTLNAPDRALSGADLYKRYCAACHQDDGRGLSGGAPPLAGNAILSRDGDYPLLAVLYGLEGEIEAGGRRFNSVMSSWSQLSDAEVAALINYIRTVWGNDELLWQDFKPLTAEDVTRARGQALTPRQVWELRKSLK